MINRDVVFIEGILFTEAEQYSSLDAIMYKHGMITICWNSNSPKWQHVFASRSTGTNSS